MVVVVVVIVVVVAVVLVVVLVVVVVTANVVVVVLVVVVVVPPVQAPQSSGHVVQSSAASHTPFPQQFTVVHNCHVSVVVTPNQQEYCRLRFPVYIGRRRNSYRAQWEAKPNRIHT